MIYREIDYHLDLIFCCSSSFAVVRGCKGSSYDSTDPARILDRADCNYPTRQHEVDHTDHTDRFIFPEGSTVGHHKVRMINLICLR